MMRGKCRLSLEKHPMKMKEKHSVGFKMAVAVAFSLFVVISIFSHTSVRMSEKKLLELAEAEASKFSSAIKSSLENSMLTGVPQNLQLIIDSVGKEDMVRDIKIIDRDAIVKYAKNHADINSQLDKTAKSCRLCHNNGTTNHENLTVMFTAEDGTRVLRNVNPIHNDKRCQKCHAQEIDVLGKLLMDFTTTDIDQMVAENRQLLIWSAVATLLCSVGLCFLLSNILVKRPLRKLLTKMQFASNEITGTGKIYGRDEIAIIDSTYDSLMNTLEERNMRIHQQMGEMMALFTVSEILNKSESINDNFDMILQALSLGFNVQECAIFAVDNAGTLREKGVFGMDEVKTAAILSCLNRQREIVDKSANFIADGCDSLDQFLVVPLKATGKTVGVITIHEVTDKELDDTEIQQSFAIIATALAPHFQIGLTQTEQADMQTGPFNAFVTTIEEKINKIREYSGTLSLAVISIENYASICEAKGTQEASNEIQQLAAALSKKISVVHECSRTCLNTIAILLPMQDSVEALEIINQGLASLNTDLQLQIKTINASVCEIIVLD